MHNVVGGVGLGFSGQGNWALGPKRFSGLKVRLKRIFLGSFYPNLVFFGHNVWTRNLRKSSKGSKDLDFSLVSTNNLSTTLSPYSWGPGPDNLGQKGSELSRLWHHPHETRNPMLFNSFKGQTRFATSFEDLNSSLAQLTSELCSCKMAWKYRIYM